MVKNNRRRRSSRFQDLTGKTFGRWAVLRFLRWDERKHGSYYLCRCECGREDEVHGPNLTAEKSRCCKSCAQTTHGATRRANPRVAEYVAWQAMKGRCHRTGYGTRNHAGRGIRICRRWHDSYEAFLADMGRRPTAAHSVDREDNDGHYSCGKCGECQTNGWPANCRWATPAEQAGNTRLTIRITFGGVTLSLSGWAREVGLHVGTIRHRLATGMSIEEALATPRRKGGRPRGSKNLDV